MKKEQLKKPMEVVPAEEEKATAPTFSMAGAEPAEAKPKEAGLSVEARLAKLEALLAGRQEQAEALPTAGTYYHSLKAKEEAQRKAKAEALLAKLRLQEQEAKAMYPKLSLAQEVKDPHFVELLKCGLDVRSAFEVIHKDEILAASMEYAARETERMMTNKILATGLRPAENGGNHAPAVTKTDVRSMSRQDRKALIARVRAGEKITL